MDKIIIVNKEKDYTSRDVVNIISGIFKTKKVGHFGTLDPLATGVLVIGIGNYTKVLNLLTNDDKEYIAKVKVGVSTDTYDITGNIVSKKNIKDLPKDKLVEALKYFEKTYLQEVPIYSAVKVNGKKLYQYKRNNEEVQLPKKKVTIKKIELLNIEEDNSYFTFKVVVSKGTYIRSLINDLSNYLSIPLAMAELIRTRQDIFNLKDAYTIHEIKNNKYKLLDIEDLFPIKVIKQYENYKLIENGNLLDYQGNDLELYKKDNKNIALYKYNKEKNKMQPFIIFK